MLDEVALRGLNLGNLGAANSIRTIIQEMRWTPGKTKPALPFKRTHLIVEEKLPRAARIEERGQGISEAVAARGEGSEQRNPLTIKAEDSVAPPECATNRTGESAGRTPGRVNNGPTARGGDKKCVETAPVSHAPDDVLDQALLEPKGLGHLRHSHVNSE